VKKPGRSSWVANTQHVQPDGKIRRSQLITTFGPGAMVDLVGDAVVIGGLDFWQGDGMEVIAESRLCASINARRRQQGLRELRTEAAFRAAPVGDDQQARRGHGIRAVEFPAWFVCQNPECRALVQAWHGLERKGDHYLHGCDNRRSGAVCVPVRFVAACVRGHLQEFPWLSFVHQERGTERCEHPRLTLEEGASGDFADIWVRCRGCKSSRPLSRARARGTAGGCKGERPWLGSEGNEPGCEEMLSLVVRTASDAYFSLVESALSIPPMKELALRAAIDGVWNMVQTATPSSIGPFRTIPDVRHALEGWSDAEVLVAIGARRAGTPVEQGPVRTAEFGQFMAAPEEVPGTIAPPGQDFFARMLRRDRALPAGIERVVLASKLREVRAQVGFTRLMPVSSDLQGEYKVVPAALGLQTDWLPATEVRGEGIFVRLDEEAVRGWEQRPEVRQREAELRAGFAKWAEQLKEPPDFPGVRFYLLHSLAHLLMTALSLECGYAASAIRERLYCSLPGDPLPMAGILLATGSSGTDGTLGGLVDQGRRLLGHLRAAWDAGVLCSNDPVCGHHTPRGDLTGRLLEGAACHGCLFVAECSCERFNQYLDRALVVPTLGCDGSVAFFRERP
jgi:hypothetical protein